MQQLILLLDLVFLNLQFKAEGAVGFSAED